MAVRKDGIVVSFGGNALLMKSVGPFSPVRIISRTATVDAKTMFVPKNFFGKKIIERCIESLILGIVRFLKKIEYALLIFEIAILSFILFNANNYTANVSPIKSAGNPCVAKCSL